MPRKNIRNPLEELLGYQLRRATAEVFGRVRTIMGNYNLTHTASSFLMLVEANPGITQSTIGKILSIKRANIAPMTSEMEERGLIRREAVDGRSQGLYLTAEGKVLVEEVREKVVDQENEFISLFKPDEYRELLDALSRVWKNAG